MSPNGFPSTNVGVIIHAEHDSSVGLMPPPVTENTSESTHDRCNMVNATRLDATRLDPGAGHTDSYGDGDGDGDNNGNGWASAAGLDG